MTEVNWNNFKAKFNGKEQQSFEVLSYLLFCDEFNQKFGIFRYFNQAGIETEPIQVKGEWSGFQAKFYETKISHNKKEIKDSIEKAKRKNPELDKIYFYLNQEFSESSEKGKKEPQYKTEIEDFAKIKDIEIIWKVSSHFQAQLSRDENKTLAQYFFSLEKGIVDFIGELNNHASAILKPIHSQIEFNGTRIKIDRSKTLNSLKDTLKNSQIVILSGEGGVGKTALVKDFYDSIGKTVPLFIFKATEFNVAHINNLFQNYGNFTLADFVAGYADADEKYIVIDSAEKLADLESLEAFQEFLSTLLQENWKIVFTTRYSYFDDLKFQFVEIYRLSFQLFDIEKIDSEELENLSDEYDFILPKEERLLELLQNPFYLSEYLQIYKNLDETTNYSEFKNLLWNKQILRSSYRKNNIHLKRENCFLTIAKSRAESGSFFVNVDECDEAALKALESDEIVKYDAAVAGYFIAHDIYEEWALDKIIERNFRASDKYKSFFESLGSSLPVRRAFRNWLSEKLYSSRNEIKSLIEKSFIGDEVEEFWKDEILVSILLSDYSEAFFEMFERMLLANDQEILTRIIFLLRITCKEIDERLLQLFGLKIKDRFALNMVFTKPKGAGWNCTIDFIHKHKEDIQQRVRQSGK